MPTLHAKARHCLAACTDAGADVDHAGLFALGAVCGLHLASVGEVRLGPPTETLAWSGAYIGHVISLAPAKDGASQTGSW